MRTLADVREAVDRAVRAEVEAAGQMTLGEIIEALRRRKKDAYVTFRFGGISPGRLTSYRGYYDHLAIVPDSAFMHVGEFLQHCEKVLGSTMSGYKGGDYVMDDDTPVWVARWGHTSNTRVTDVTGDTDDNFIVIETAEIE